MPFYFGHNLGRTATNKYYRLNYILYSHPENSIDISQINVKVSFV